MNPQAKAIAIALARVRDSHSAITTTQDGPDAWHRGYKAGCLDTHDLIAAELADRYGLVGEDRAEFLALAHAGDIDKANEGRAA